MKELFLVTKLTVKNLARIILERGHEANPPRFLLGVIKNPKFLAHLQQKDSDLYDDLMKATSDLGLIDGSLLQVLNLQMKTAVVARKG